MDTPESNLTPETPETPTAEPVAAESAPLAPPQSTLPEDLQVPWGWTDLGAVLLVGLGSAVVASQVAAYLVMMLWEVSPAAYDKIPAAKAAYVTLTQTLMWLAVFVFLFAVSEVRFGQRFWHALKWRDLRLEGVSRAKGYLACLLGGSVFAFLIQLASGLTPREKELPIEELFKSRESVQLIAAAAILVAPLAEETFFRGFLYPLFARRMGIFAGVMLTGALFGMMHGGQLDWSWERVGLLTVVGVVLTYVRARTGTVLAPYLLHLGYNSILFVVFFFAPGGYRDLPK
jgi:membrane protease YdiL (CAAX protease family)